MHKSLGSKIQKGLILFSMMHTQHVTLRFWQKENFSCENEFSMEDVGIVILEQKVEKHIYVSCEMFYVACVARSFQTHMQTS